MQALLALEDGKIFKGHSFGSGGEALGEVVFNTSMAGYQEIITDPSYKGQIVMMTYPLIGNYGVNKEDVESRRPFLEGFVVKEYSNYILDQYDNHPLDPPSEIHASKEIDDAEKELENAITEEVKKYPFKEGINNTGAVIGNLFTLILEGGAFMTYVDIIKGYLDKIYLKESLDFERGKGCPNCPYGRRNTLYLLGPTTRSCRQWRGY